MKRTIEINPRDTVKSVGDVFYRGKKVDYLLNAIRTNFKMHDGGKYQITIVEGGKYSFKIHDVEGDNKVYMLYNKKTYISYLCKEKFDKVFFAPDENKSYDITVKKVK